MNFYYADLVNLLVFSYSREAPFKLPILVTSIHSLLCFKEQIIEVFEKRIKMDSGVDARLVFNHEDNVAIVYGTNEETHEEVGRFSLVRIPLFYDPLGDV
jgi:hypothetical protein